MSRESIAKALKRLREQSGLTADQVGELVGKSGKTVNAWENNRGQPDAEILIKLCDIYDVGDILSEFRDDTPKYEISLSDREKAIIIAYRTHPDMQHAVDTLLGLNIDSNVFSSLDDRSVVYRAARSSDNHEDEIISISKERIQKLKDAPETDEDL